MKSVICSSSLVSDPARPASARAASARRRHSAARSRAPVEPELAHVGALAQPLVAALVLAERLLGPGHIENVVHDLEKHPELPSKDAEARHSGRLLDTGQQQHALDARCDQASGLQLVQPAQPGRAGRRRPGDIDVLARDHPLGPGRVRELAGGGEQPRRLRLLPREQQHERLGVEPVAGQDRDVLAERDVAGRPAAAQVVVVHRGEVVVDQRIGVDQLDRDRQRKHPLGVAAERRGGRERQHRPDPLAAREQRVAHRLIEPLGRRLGRESQRLEIALDLGAQVLGIGRRRRGYRVVAARRREPRCRGHYDAGSGSWPGRSGSGSSAARFRWSTRELASLASRAHSSISESAVPTSTSGERSSSAASSSRTLNSVRRSFTPARVAAGGCEPCQAGGAGLTPGRRAPRSRARPRGRSRPAGRSGSATDRTHAGPRSRRRRAASSPGA